MWDWFTNLFGDAATSAATDAAVNTAVTDGILGASSTVGETIVEETATGGLLDDLSWGAVKDAGKLALGAGVKTFDGKGGGGMSRRPSSIGLNLNSTDRMSGASMPSPAKTSNYDDFYSQWTARMRGLSGR